MAPPASSPRTVAPHDTGGTGYSTEPGRAVAPTDLGRTPLPPELDREIKQRRLMLRLKRALVVGGATILAFILVLPTTAQGVRTNVPDMGTRLSKTPLLGPKLFAGPSLAKVDLAYLVGLCVFGLTLYFGSKAAGLLLASDASHEVNHEPAHLVIVGGASLSLLADAALLYLGLCDRMWGKTSFSFIALLFTTVYVLGIVAVSLILTNIRTELSQLEDR